MCLDDKSKINFGEPGTVMATGVRGKQQIGPSSSTISAADHDVNNKGHLTPSVILNVEIPDSVDKSFCRGDVVVYLNDSVFQASTPFRHATSVCRLLSQQQDKPVLLLFTDGGPDHRLTYHSVQVSLISLFQALDLDMLVAARCAPRHSWVNPVERIMSLLNLALQNVGLERDRCAQEIEDIIKKCSGMAPIRKAAENHPDKDIEAAWIESLERIVQLLQGRFERLSLKECPVVTKDPVTKDQIEGLQGFVTAIDPEIDMNKLQAKFLSTKAAYQNFVTRHCRARNYTFQIRKCDDAACCGVTKLSSEDLMWLPDPEPDDTGEHFKKYEEVVGTETAQEHMPSGKNFRGPISEEEQGCKTSELTAQHARKTVTCQECEKPRVVYSTRKPTAQDLVDIQAFIEECDYTCGSMLVPVNHRLYKKVFVRLALNCADHIEFAYYSSQKFVPGICCFCTEPTTGGPRRTALREKYRVVLPVCSQCLDSGKDFPKNRPFKNK